MHILAQICVFFAAIYDRGKNPVIIGANQMKSFIIILFFVLLPAKIPHPLMK